ncbi:TRI41 ligase, partial [Thryothorus ludovicianus]|nr:TRI41 ligase [Thryothorus ludovicianus]
RGKNLWGYILFPDTLECSLEEDSDRYQRDDNRDLNPATAHPQILTSLDGLTAGCWESPPALLPSGMECFESLCCLLGQQGFVGDWHCWAVKICPSLDWALEMAREFMSHK